MNHADALAHLEDYFDGTLSADVHREIEAHLAGCTRCRDELSSLGALLDTVAEMRGKQVEPSRDLWPEIAAQIAPASRTYARPGGVPARRGDGDRAVGRGDPFRRVAVERRVRWPWLTGAAGIAAAALLLIAVLGGWDGRFRLPAGFGGAGSAGRAPDAAVSSATTSADGANAAVARELAMLGAQVESSRQSVRPGSGAGIPGLEADDATDGAPGRTPHTAPGTTSGTMPGTTPGTTVEIDADTTAATPSWRLFDQGLAVLDLAIKDSRVALERDPNNPVLQKSLLGAYQKQLELIRWANRVVRQS